MPAHLDNVVNPEVQARNINDTEKMFEKHKTRMCLRVHEDLNFVTNPSFYLFLYSVNISRLPVYEHSQGAWSWDGYKDERISGTLMLGATLSSVRSIGFGVRMTRVCNLAGSF